MFDKTLNSHPALFNFSTGKLNQLGGMFVNGKPLPNSVRQRIIEMAELGIRPCDISRQLRISHGCISKLLSKYNETGSFEPGRAKRKTSRDVSTEVKNKIEEYRRETPAIFSWEVRDRLVTDGLCNKESLPPLTVISRLLRRARSESDAPNESARQNENKPKGFTAFSIDNILRKEEQMETSTSPTETESDSGKYLPESTINKYFHNLLDTAPLITSNSFSLLKLLH